jgi:alpha-1,2-mannosyltransferase
MSQLGPIQRPASLAIAGLGLGALVVLLGVGVLAFGFGPADALTYLAAGDRLNLGHPLYVVSPDDTYILGNKPPYWTVPLLSPPFIAVIWRPLDALPFGPAIALWWAGAIVSIGIAIVALVRERPGAAGAAILVLSIPLAFQIPTGNVNGYLLLAAVATWWFARQGKDTSAGIVVGVATALKLTPGILLVWLITQRRWGAVRSAIATLAVCAVISLVGAGWDNHLAYLDVVFDTNAIGTSVLSIAGALRSLGLPPEVARFGPWLVVGLGVIVMAVAWRRPAVTFVVAVGVMVFGSPVVNLDWLSLLIAALAPLAWPMAGIADAEVDPARVGGDQAAASSRDRAAPAPS